MIEILSASTQALVLERAIKEKLLESESAAIFIDLTRLKSLLTDLKKTFPPDSLHAIAIKANPVFSILKILSQFGVGAEVASVGELALALEAGFSPANIVYDSPVKSETELREAVKSGASINVDNFSELLVLAAIISNGKAANQNFGIRINPQTAVGTVSYTVTAGHYSKFGISLNDNREKLFEAYKENKFLNSVHVHVGSQACSIEILSEAVAKIVDFANDVNQKVGGLQIKFFDLGGGLPSPYYRDMPVASFAEYVSLLRASCPALFDGRFKLITEFGRHIHSGCGWAVSTVEAVKEQSNKITALIHLGADMFVRECYRPADWHHEFTVCEPDGKLKSGAGQNYTLAGPLCFSGDILASDIELPSIQKSDWIVASDVGAYSFSMWSRYNSRPMPKIIGYFNDGEVFTILKEKESLAKVVDFWR